MKFDKNSPSNGSKGEIFGRRDRNDLPCVHSINALRAESIVIKQNSCHVDSMGGQENEHGRRLCALHLWDQKNMANDHSDEKQ